MIDLGRECLGREVDRVGEAVAGASAHHMGGCTAVGCNQRLCGLAQVATAI